MSARTREYAGIIFWTFVFAAVFVLCDYIGQQ